MLLKGLILTLKPEVSKKILVSILELKFRRQFDLTRNRLQNGKRTLTSRAK